MPADLPVEPVGEESVELLAHNAHLREQRALLLDNREEVHRHVVLCEHQGLAAKGAHLGTADIEQVCQFYDVLQAHVAGGAHDTVAHPRSVKIQGNAVLPAGLGQGGQFRLRVQGAHLRGMGDVNHAGADHVLGGVVGQIGLHVPRQNVGHELAVRVRQGQYLVAAGLDGAGLVDVHVAGGCADHALIAAQHAGDGDAVGLCAAGKKLDLQVVPPAGRADLPLGLPGIGIGAVTLQGDQVALQKVLQHLRMRAFGVVGCKRQHDFSLP